MSSVVRARITIAMLAGDPPEEFGIVVGADGSTTVAGGPAGADSGHMLRSERFPAQHRDCHDRDECQQVRHVAHLLTSRVIPYAYLRHGDP